MALESEEAAACSVPGASPWASEKGVRGRRTGWEGKGLGYRETGAGEGSRFTTKTDYGPRCFGPLAGTGVGMGVRKSKGPRCAPQQGPERSPDAGWGGHKPLPLFCSPSFFHCLPKSSHQHG